MTDMSALIADLERTAAGARAAGLQAKLDQLMQMARELRLVPDAAERMPAAPQGAD